jgi:hypothetical protein
MTRYENNPFTPQFGMLPAQLAGRSDFLSKIKRALNAPLGDPYRSTVFEGARGVGKTVVLREISKFALEAGMISVTVNASDGMLDEILRQVEKNGSEFIQNQKKQISSINTPFGGIGFSSDKKADLGFRTTFEIYLEQLNEAGAGLLLNIDEADISFEELRTIVQVYQLMIGEQHNIAMMMAGLPFKIDAVFNDTNISFFRRAELVHLGAISEAETKIWFRDVVKLGGKQLESEAMDTAAKLSGGFPFLMQALGYEAWDLSGAENIIQKQHVEDGILRAQDKMFRSVLQVTLDELSDGDRDFIKAMAKDDGESRIKDIGERMRKTSGYLSKYRERLMTDDIIYSTRYGYVDFAIPMIRDYIRDGKLG